jgi:hypothetical protein
MLGVCVRVTKSGLIDDRSRSRSNAAQCFSFERSRHAPLEAGLGSQATESINSAGHKQSVADSLSPAYCAFNCAVTAWHVSDWAWQSADPETQQKIASRLGFSLASDDERNFDRFADAICTRSRELRICREIAKGSLLRRASTPLSSRSDDFRLAATCSSSPSRMSTASYAQSESSQEHLSFRSDSWGNLGSLKGDPWSAEDRCLRTYDSVVVWLRCPSPFASLPSPSPATDKREARPGFPCSRLCDSDSGQRHGPKDRRSA